MDEPHITNIAGHLSRGAKGSTGAAGGALEQARPGDMRVVALEIRPSYVEVRQSTNRSASGWSPVAEAMIATLVMERVLGERQRPAADGND